MQIIRFRSDGGPVTFQFAIHGLVVWRYRYVGDGAEFVRKSTQGDPPLHALGTPAELQADANSWGVQLASPDAVERAYEVTITWFQDGAVIHQWKRVGKTPADEAREERDDAFLMGGA